MVVPGGISCIDFIPVNVLCNDDIVPPLRQVSSGSVCNSYGFKEVG